MPDQVSPEAVAGEASDAKRLTKLRLPIELALDARLHQHRLMQARRAERELEGTFAPWSRRGVAGHALVTDAECLLLVPQRIAPPREFPSVLVVSDEVIAAAAAGAAEVDARVGRWPTPRADAASESADECARRSAAARDSWQGQFAFKAERRDGEVVLDPGLRPPQIGALHAILAHWTVTTTDPATVVMPTGTGKTETMLAVLVAARPETLLVVVPTDALRDQISKKFLELGLLQRFGVIAAGAHPPVVGVLRRRPTSVAEVDEVFRACNVVVTTMSVAGGCAEDVQAAMAANASHLVIDEAHHIGARTWARFRRHFAARPVLQFTATPFRGDRRHVDGKVIYNYPLRKAQEEGYFKPITFLPIAEYDVDEADGEIARTSCGQLDQDLAAGFDHLVMARAGSIDRAREVLRAYARLGVLRRAAGDTAYDAVLIHSELSADEQRDAWSQLERRQARVLVCVDMFGEGFDMPELKIAALHDMHKSLAVTLQFTGRFTRSRPDLGSASVVANIAGARVAESLRALYAEDADWNILLREMSSGATGRQSSRVDLLAGFPPPPTPITIPLQNVSPKLSTVVYRTACDEWRPDLIEDFVGEDRLYAGPFVNQKARIALFVTRELEEVRWGEVRELINTTWDIYMLHWDEEQKLLFIHSAVNDSLHRELACLVAGDDATLISGEPMFRGFHGMHRLIFMNLGLKHALGRGVQFTMYTGADVVSALSDSQQSNKVKSNMFGHGYENGERASYGCSYKGRAWSYRKAVDVGDWMEWCRAVGAKLLDESITTRAALEHALIPKQVKERPAGVPIMVQWPDELLYRDEEVVSFRIGSEETSLLDVSIEVANPTPDGPIRFRVFSDAAVAVYEVAFEKGRIAYQAVGDEAELIVGRRALPLSEYFVASPPAIHFSTGAFLVRDALFEIEHRPPYDPARIEMLDWTGIDLAKESQGLGKEPDSIQRRVIEWLTAAGAQPAYDIVFDDDAPGEAADVVALGADGDRLRVLLVHCKFARGRRPGAQVKDLYEVCGQAQRSVIWRSKVDRLLEHLARREAKRRRAGMPSRFEKGSTAALRALQARVRELAIDFRVAIAQPGLSSARASVSQRELLGVTDFYLREMAATSLQVLASP